MITIVAVALYVGNVSLGATQLPARPARMGDTSHVNML